MARERKGRHASGGKGRQPSDRCISIRCMASCTKQKVNPREQFGKKGGVFEKKVLMYWERNEFRPQFLTDSINCPSYPAGQALNGRIKKKSVKGPTTRRGKNATRIRIGPTSSSPLSGNRTQKSPNLPHRTKELRGAAQKENSTTVEETYPYR